MGSQNPRLSPSRIMVLLTSLFLTFLSSTHPFSLPPTTTIISTTEPILQRTTHLSAKKQSRSTITPKTSSSSPTTPSPLPNNNNPDEPTEEVYGTKFFGGSAVKEDLFDAELEESADLLQRLYPRQKSRYKRPEEKEGESIYQRFEDDNAFTDVQARDLAKRVQGAFNRALYETDDSAEEDVNGQDDRMLYAKEMASRDWITPFLNGNASRAKSQQKKGGLSDGGVTPLEALGNSLEYYKRVDVAIVAGRTLGEEQGNKATVELRWEISLLWPNVFESRVLISGVSIVTTLTNDQINNGKPSIVSQKDLLDHNGIGPAQNNKKDQDIFTNIAPQLLPRFWDLYHVGMTPSSELTPRTNVRTKGDVLLSPLGIGTTYEIYDMPPRLVLRPTLVDVGGRMDREAETVPNHAFTTVIKTTGRTGQRFVPAGPVEVAIRRRSRAEVYSEEKEEKEGTTAGGGGSVSVVEWDIPLPPEFLSYDETLPLPPLNPEDLSSEFDSLEDYRAYNPKCSYVYRPQRRVATVPYDGSPQDAGITEIRKKLYEKVVIKDGLRPKLDSEGKPMFFFLQNDAKACFTPAGGFGMVVYDWRPKGAGSNRVGIELELE